MDLFELQGHKSLETTRIDVTMSSDSSCDKTCFQRMQAETRGEVTLT